MHTSPIERLREVIAGVGPDGAIDLLACAFDDIAADQSDAQKADQYAALCRRLSKIKVSANIKNDRPPVVV